MIKKWTENPTGEHRKGQAVQRFYLKRKEPGACAETLLDMMDALLKLSLREELMGSTTP